MVNNLKVTLDWNVWLDWLWSILWPKFIIKTKEKKKKKEHIFFPFQTWSFTNVFMRLNGCTNTNITFYVNIMYRMRASVWSRDQTHETLADHKKAPVSATYVHTSRLLCSRAEQRTHKSPGQWRHWLQILGYGRNRGGEHSCYPEALLDHFPYCLRHGDHIFKNQPVSPWPEGSAGCVGGEYFLIPRSLHAQPNARPQRLLFLLFHPWPGKNLILLS